LSVGLLQRPQCCHGGGIGLDTSHGALRPQFGEDINIPFSGKSGHASCFDSKSSPLNN
jgi:hypothetical protein